MALKLISNADRYTEIAKAIPAAIQGYYDAEDRSMKRKEMAAKMAAERDKEGLEELKTIAYLNETIGPHATEVLMASRHSPGGIQSLFGNPENGLMGGPGMINQQGLIPQEQTPPPIYAPTIEGAQSAPPQIENLAQPENVPSENKSQFEGIFDPKWESPLKIKRELEKAQLEKIRNEPEEKEREQKFRYGFVPQTDASGKEVRNDQGKLVYVEHPLKKVQEERTQDKENRLKSKKMDDDFQKQLANYQPAKVEKNFNDLYSSVEELKKLKPNRLIGFSPQVWQKFYSKELGAIRNKVEKVVAQQVKGLFPGAISNYETQSVIQRAFDPALGWENMVNSLQSEIKYLVDADVETRKKMQYFNEHKNTLYGYDFSGGKAPVYEKSKSHPDVRQNGVLFRWNSKANNYEAAE